MLSFMTSGKDGKSFRVGEEVILDLDRLLEIEGDLDLLVLEVEVAPLLLLGVNSGSTESSLGSTCP